MCSLLHFCLQGKDMNEHFQEKGQFHTRREPLPQAGKGHFNKLPLAALLGANAPLASAPFLLEPPRHQVTSLSSLTQSQQSQEEKNKPTSAANIQTSQRRQHRETYYEHGLCADVICRSLSNTCVCLSHEITFEQFLSPVFCLDGRK